MSKYPKSSRHAESRDILTEGQPRRVGQLCRGSFNSDALQQRAQTVRVHSKNYVILVPTSHQA